ncbi:uncharacterized protein LOC132599659 [Lycium barbarum]|uniref:uncharacterized protein LOC132599659 n=1 Tax=Lycium barbarum TaxID=112863 RepID=UPI00293E4300|nr:uncharacterized protein LOC132599659 [Lycium barbarum]
MNLIMIMEMTSVILQQMKNIFLKMNMMQMRMMIGCDFQLLQDNFGYYNHFLYRISVLPSSSRSINLTCQPRTPFNFQTHNTFRILSLKELIICIDIVVKGPMIISRNLLQRRKDYRTSQKRLMKLNGNSW